MSSGRWTAWRCRNSTSGTDAGSAHCRSSSTRTSGRSTQSWSSSCSIASNRWNSAGGRRSSAVEQPGRAPRDPTPAARSHPSSPSADRSARSDLHPRPQPGAPAPSQHVPTADRAPRRPASSRTSSARRVLPTPGSPEMSTSRPMPARAPRRGRADQPSQRLLAADEGEACPRTPLSPLPVSRARVPISRLLGDSSLHTKGDPDDPQRLPLRRRPRRPDGKPPPDDGAVPAQRARPPHRRHPRRRASRSTTPAPTSPPTRRSSPAPSSGAPSPRSACPARRIEVLGEVHFAHLNQSVLR